MTNRPLSHYPPSYLKDLRDRAEYNVERTLASWHNPDLSKEDMDTLRLISMILVAISPQGRG